MRILITGAKGQLGREFQKILPEQTTSVDQDDFDITDEKETAQWIAKIKPNVIIHCAAYTQVAQAESDQKKCFLVNKTGTENIAKAAKKISAKMVYISTDYVFDGKKGKPYGEKDKPRPLNVYGRSKLAGEKIVVQALKDYLIIRSAWLYGPSTKLTTIKQVTSSPPASATCPKLLHRCRRVLKALRAGKKNFVQKILEKAKNDKALQVVVDQIGSPTYTLHLAQKIAQLVKKNKTGLYHITNQGQASWYDFAQAILKIAKIQTPVEPITTQDLREPLKRPKFSVLANERLKKEGLKLLPSWQKALREYLKKSQKSKIKSQNY